ncbi:MAG: hypothetical protein AAF975_04650 [Spirochaetota bacterium]
MSVARIEEYLSERDRCVQYGKPMPRKGYDSRMSRWFLVETQSIYGENTIWN